MFISWVPGLSNLTFLYDWFIPSKTDSLKVPFSPESSKKTIKAYTFEKIDLKKMASESIQELNKNWDAIVNEFAKKLISLPIDAEERGNLECILSNLSFENIEKFFNEIVDQSAGKEPFALPDPVIEAIPLDQVIEHLRQRLPKFEGIEAWMQKAASLLPDEFVEVSFGDQRKNAKSQNVVTRFFPNLIHTFLRAFDLFDGARPPDTLYEYGVLVALYFHFFKLPYYLFQSVGAFCSSPLTTLVSGVSVLAIGVGLLYTYLRWLKRCPDQVSYCENLTKKSQDEPPQAVLCREAEYAEAINCIGKERDGTGINIALIGEPGCGKTEWIKGLPCHLPEKKIFLFQNFQLFGSSACVKSPAEKMADAFREVRFYENEVLFVCDELGDAFESRPQDLEAFLKPALGNKQIPFVAVMTNEQWEALKKKDKAFEERFRPIFFKPADEAQTKRILIERLRRKGRNLPISGKVLDQIIEETDQIKEHAQPRKAINRLDELINQLSRFHPGLYKPQTLSDAEIHLQNLKDKIVLSDSILNDPFSAEYQKYMAELEEAKKNVQDLTLQAKKQRKAIRKMVAYQRLQLFYLQKMEDALRKISGSQKLEQEANEKLQKEFIFIHFFACRKVQHLIKHLASALPSDLPIRID